MNSVKTISDIGEKEIIERLLRPLFNPENDANGVGDDCAVIEIPHGNMALLSTDRVPADLISFRTGILDYFGIGRYLAVLNISDIAACGGQPEALLLNFGLRSDFPISDLLSICEGVVSVVEPMGVRVLGGDMSLSSELSISATCLGYVEKGRMLRRSGAHVGDSVFVSRKIGLTPVALHYCLSPEVFSHYDTDDIITLKGQFSALSPMIELGHQLVAADQCSSAMDNTDGIWQSLNELSRESALAVVLDKALLKLPTIVQKFAAQIAQDPLTLALGAGADFSLVGTLRGGWTTETASSIFGKDIQIIGYCTEGSGVLLKTEEGVTPFQVPGWNYFSF